MTTKPELKIGKKLWCARIGAFGCGDIDHVTITDIKGEGIRIRGLFVKSMPTSTFYESVKAENLFDTEEEAKEFIKSDPTIREANRKFGERVQKIIDKSLGKYQDKK